MPMELFDPNEGSAAVAAYGKATYHSFAFCESGSGGGGTSSKARSRRHSSRRKYVEDKVELDVDERVELYAATPTAAGTSSRGSSTRPRYKTPPQRKRSTQPPPSQPASDKPQRGRGATVSSFQWDDAGGDSSILASFPFHASSFKDNNDDVHDGDFLTGDDDENVYDYEINEDDLYKYTPKATKPPPPANNNRHLSAGAARHRYATDSDDVHAQQSCFDRPPSRQCHAFPIHLVDQSSDDEQQPLEPQQQARTTFKRRPPSRHKHLSRSQKQIADTFASSCDINEQSLEDTINRFRSRRNADSLMRLQSHDPMRDGFEAVDETVPLPFRIEVTTRDQASPPPYGKPKGGGNSCRRQRPQAPPPSAAYDEMRRTLQSRAEDPVVVKITAPERRRPVPARGVPQSSPFQWMKDDAASHPFFENTSVLSPDTNWIPTNLDGDVGPETNSSDGGTSARTDDLKLDDFNFSATPPAPPESASLRTSLGMDFLSLFAQS
ncbi:Aste57867_9798 [Aphanomyces stellatus]|uniref:Aste57867_9798 protein n=1 Tax=Aphanomyces stellatus TaxID=120398 RepID=A0A485KP33_9STRA|nr:hypothetical protein As57867_009759 [Aphanomyces stellatus]VFT86677.1 Aste57867_9798 [Aphanomyces stellatus]